MTRTYILPAGEYWIGDPEFIFPKNKLKLLNEIKKSTNDFETVTSFKTPNINIWCQRVDSNFNYSDKTETHYFYSQSGFLGIVPRETVHYLRHQILILKQNGLFITFDEEFKVVFDDDFCKFGHIEIELT